MSASETPLEELLRSSAVTNGSISLSRINGSAWRAVICHHQNGAEHPLGHMIHPFDDWRDDPVEALRVALIEDERQSRDLKRRYDAAPKFGDAVMHARADAQAGVDPDFDAAEGTCVVCESGGSGCDACRPDPLSNMDDLLG